YDAVLRVVTTGSEIGIAEDLPSVDDDVSDGVVSSGRTEAGSTGDGTQASEPAIAPGVPETIVTETTTVVEKPAPPMTTIVEPEAPDILIAPAPPTASSTRLTTLGIADMKELGVVSGLAPGETVRSSRFIGPMAYVVTFRQTDPLFAIDVSDPSSPKVLGELKIPGFSEYLHPVGDGLLLGVGRDVDPVSLIDNGLKLSLFDVSNPKAPVEVDTWTRPDSYSPVGQNHHAFTWDAKRNRAIVPIEGGCSDDQAVSRRSVTPTIDPDQSVSSPPSDPTAGITAEEYMAQMTCNFAMVFEVSNAKITEVASFSHPYPAGQPDSVALGRALPDRSLIVGSVLWSRSIVGIGYSPVSDPANLTFIPFG
ncbi:MAG: beta-propeller domain-containing protein, partial [Microthrixaceae bacterium]|nr:beta-propeller domain-containing protein [Microthrixaceae bacterium]